jgi:hypothetical protein
MAVAEVQQAGSPRATCLYVPEIGPFSALIFEAVFESLAEYEEFWTEWFASREGATFDEKWGELTKNGGTNEIWSLVDLE